jgi:hypothetical protein
MLRTSPTLSQAHEAVNYSSPPQALHFIDVTQVSRSRRDQVAPRFDQRTCFAGICASRLSDAIPIDVGFEPLFLEGEAFAEHRALTAPSVGHRLAVSSKGVFKAYIPRRGALLFWGR